MFVQLHYTNYKHHQKALSDFSQYKVTKTDFLNTFVIMIKIYHNPRCSKSREGVNFLKQRQINFEIVEYLKSNIDKEELTSIITKLGLDSPLELIRKNEKIWKENFKDKALTNQELIEAMIENPKLIQRPIIVNSDKAIIGRPTTAIENILD